jgi:Thioesterase superfamily
VSDATNDTTDDITDDITGDLNGWIAESRRAPHEPSSQVAARRALAAETRTLIEALFLATEADEATLAAAAALVRDAAAMLPVDAVTRNFMEISPLRGPSNPVAPPMHVRIDGDVLWADVRFGWAYEGPPAHVHGGLIAAAFDEALGMVQALSGRPGMTGNLTVKYRSPTPLHSDLVIEARVTSVEGRKIFTKAWLRHGDVLCAEAEGLFISVDASRFGELSETRLRR